MSNNRVLNIVNLLLQSDNYITIDTISKELDVSNKTIRNDLKLVEEWLKENDLKLIKKTGVGVTIEGERVSKLHILNLVESKNKKLVDFSPEARKLYLAMRLITSTENCRVYELANDLYVSRATIHKDLLSLSPILDNHKIKLNRKNNNGISITGKERNLRNLLIELMLNDNGYETFINIIKNAAYQCDGSFVFSGIDYIDDEYKEFI
ncbi:HTH domain-containing protein, partial [Clostridium perfringens]